MRRSWSSPAATPVPPRAASRSGSPASRPARRRSSAGGVALTWLRGTPGIVQKFLAAISRGRRKKDLDAPTASELRRNGRILLADTKTLKSNVKNLQRTFSVFQR